MKRLRFFDFVEADLSVLASEDASVTFGSSTFRSDAVDDALVPLRCLCLTSIDTLSSDDIAIPQKNKNIFLVNTQLGIYTKKMRGEVII